MISLYTPLDMLVNCRVGSLEKIVFAVNINYRVNCRVGSLENVQDVNFSELMVNCRVGSLEKNQGRDNNDNDS